MEVTISKFKATCLELLRAVQKTGEPLIVTRLGKPIAQVLPPPPEPESRGKLFGSAPGKITGDILSPASDESEWEVLRKDS